MRQTKKKTTKLIVFVSLSLIINSCYQFKIDPHDRLTGLTTQEFSDSVVGKKNKEKKPEESKIEKSSLPITKMIATPPPPAIGGEKTISFYVTDQVPLKDVLIELGRVSNIDIDIDPRVSGGVIINAKNRPLKEVIDRIATQGNLRYYYKNNVLYFEPDLPYLKNYFVDYIVDATIWEDVQSNIENIFSTSSSPSLSQSSEVSASPQSTVTLNKSAGMIAVFATKKQHESVEKYLEDVEKQSSAQVLIEAKIIEVKLKDEFKAGIDWTSNKFIAKTESLGNSVVSSPMLSYTNRSFNFMGKNIDMGVKMLEKFGTSRTLSSPRVHAMNNQKAVLNFADKLVYFKVEAQQSSASNGSTTSTVASTITSTKQEENVGIELTITPSINLKTSEVIMNIAPKMSIKTGEVIDPASANAQNVVGAGASQELRESFVNKVPIIETRELNTIAKVQSGNVIVIGGLMKEITQNDDRGVPFFNKIPVLGWLFKSSSKESTVTETVIFIKATILNSSTRPNKIDRDMQEKFDTNRRKFL
jgi:type II secretory pathway component GspD/PulD (secretin)